MRIDDDFGDGFAIRFPSEPSKLFSKTDTLVHTVAMSRISNGHPGDYSGSYDIKFGLESSWGGDRPPEFNGSINGTYSDNRGNYLEGHFSHDNEGRNYAGVYGGQNDSFHHQSPNTNNRNRPKYTERDSRTGFSAGPKRRNSSIVTDPIFLILGQLRSTNSSCFRYRPKPILESRSV